LTAKDYLLQLPALRNRIAAKCSLVDDYIDEACRATSRIRAVAIGGTGWHSRVETWIDRKIDEERDEIEPMRRQLWQLELDVLRVTGAMPPGRWRQVIELRYLRGLGWGQVIKDMGLGRSYVFELHGHALKVFAATYSQIMLDRTIDMW
jgi:hypothetical protein